jgi:hypoxanthine phosphoribosyltransferase
MTISATFNMPELIPVIDKETIANNVAAVAKQISVDFNNTELVLVCVLKGAFVFMADLIRLLTLNSIRIEFMRLSSYGGDTTTSGKMRLLMDIEADVAGKNLLIVEDILDTGHTLAFLYKHLNTKGPRSIKTCVLIDKRERRQVDLQPDYVCHNVEQGFLVGYGLDYAEAYRNLPGIYKLNPKS